MAVEMVINYWFGYGAGNNMIKKSWQQTTSKVSCLNGFHNRKPFEVMKA